MVGHHPAKQKIPGLVTSQGTPLSGWFFPRSGRAGGSQSVVCVGLMFLSLSLPPLALKINQQIL